MYFPILIVAVEKDSDDGESRDALAVHAARGG
jgi:hypothetical protein